MTDNEHVDAGAAVGLERMTIAGHSPLPLFRSNTWRRLVPPRLRVARVALVALVALATACDETPSKPDASGGSIEGSSPLGADCESSTDCSSGLCLTGAASHIPALDRPVCSKLCSDDSDCDGESNLVCGTGPGGNRVCAPRCEETNGFACVGGESVACTEVGASKCAQCGCPEGTRCGVSGDACETLGDVGAPCAADGDCVAGNCGQDSTCKVAIGEPCDARNCDLCLTHGDWSFCSGVCEVQSDCDGAPCLKAVDEDEFTCRPLCGNMDDPICPEQCEVTSLAQETYYCRCETCEVATPDDDGTGDGMDGGTADIDAGQ